jgi:phosphonoacetaldehyde hydrolase
MKKEIQCVIMDWAGTTIDFGCFAPVNAFIKAFDIIGIRITPEEVREPMGMAKIEHIRELLRMVRIHSEFKKTHRKVWDENDVNKLNQLFEKYLFASLTDYTNPIPHVLNTVGILRQRGIKIGSTTGYTRAMMDVVEPAAKSKGYFPDNCVTPDGLPKGRPAPFMIFRNMIDLNIQSTDCVVKIGDTMEDIREGLNAKVWTVGIVVGSSELGLSGTEINRLSTVPTGMGELNERKARVRQKMTDAGAHYVIDTMAELPEVIEHINECMMFEDTFRPNRGAMSITSGCSPKVSTQDSLWQDNNLPPCKGKIPSPGQRPG